MIYERLYNQSITIVFFGIDKFQRFVIKLQMATIYASIEIKDSLLKLGLYLNVLQQNTSAERHEKTVHLAIETFTKYMENQEFAKECYDKVRALVHSQNNYFALLLLDQMLKNNKIVFRNAKREAQNLFKGVWERAWSQPNNENKLYNLKLIAKVWGYIYGEKTEENIKKWIQHTYKIKFLIPAEREAELKEIYSSPQPPKNDIKIQELLHNMDVLEQKPKPQKTSKDESLLQALGIDQD